MLMNHEYGKFSKLGLGFLFGVQKLACLLGVQNGTRTIMKGRPNGP